MGLEAQLFVCPPLPLIHHVPRSGWAPPQSPPGPAGMEPPVTFAQGNAASAPGRSSAVTHVGCPCSTLALPAVPPISLFTRFTSRSSSPPQQPREVQAGSSVACAGAEPKILPRGKLCNLWPLSPRPSCCFGTAPALCGRRKVPGVLGDVHPPLPQGSWD